jgi:hypothetical protein
LRKIVVRVGNAQSVAASCPPFDAIYGIGCFYDPGYVPASYASK